MTKTDEKSRAHKCAQRNASMPVCRVEKGEEARAMRVLACVLAFDAVVCPPERILGRSGTRLSEANLAPCFLSPANLHALARLRSGWQASPEFSCKLAGRC